MTTAIYMTGFSNFTNHDDARKAFNKRVTMAVLRLCPDGSAWIVDVQYSPIQHGQCEFVGTEPCERNW